MLSTLPPLNCRRPVLLAADALGDREEREEDHDTNDELLDVTPKGGGVSDHAVDLRGHGCVGLSDEDHARESGQAEDVFDTIHVFVFLGLATWAGCLRTQKYWIILSGVCKTHSFALYGQITFFSFRVSH